MFCTLDDAHADIGIGGCSGLTPSATAFAEVQMKPDLPTKRRHKDLESAVDKINKSAAIKTSVVLKKLLKASKAKHNAKSTADVLLDVIDEIIGAKGLIRTVSHHLSNESYLGICLLPCTDEVCRWPPARRLQELLLNCLI